MTDKEKLEHLLPYCTDFLEDIISEYLRIYLSDFTPSRLRHFIKILETFLDTKIHCYELAVDNSYEKASYIKAYLEGKMYKDEASARKNVDCQIKNSQSIINFWQIATGERRNTDES